MDVREKLFALFQDCNNPSWKWFPNNAEMLKLIEYLIANGVTVNEWISVDDRMPTQEDAPTEYVFTAYKNQNCYDVEIALLDTVIAYPDLYDYWMALPLPRPPKGE